LTVEEKTMRVRTSGRGDIKTLSRLARLRAPVRARHVLLPLVMALSLLAVPATSRARVPADAQCETACYYRVEVKGLASGDLDSMGPGWPGEARVEVGFKLFSTFATIIDPSFSVNSALNGVFTKYSGRGTDLRGSACETTITTAMRGAPPLAGELYINAVPQLGDITVRLGASPAFLNLVGLEFFQNDVPKHRCGSQDVEDKPSKSLGPAVAIDDFLLPTGSKPLAVAGWTTASSQKAFAAGVYTFTGYYHEYARSTYVKLVIDGQVEIQLHRCPHQSLKDNCPIKGWPRLPKR
jgi:hypothetical protein